MLCKYYWIVLYTVHVTAFCLGGPFFSGHSVVCSLFKYLYVILGGPEQLKSKPGDFKNIIQILTDFQNL